MRATVAGWWLVGTALGAQTVADTTRQPTVLRVQVTTATRTSQSVDQLPVSVSVLGPRELQVTAAKAVPDFLRTVPGFATRDFQSALTQHPSRSAPAVRGLGGGTSASRMLVLLDGVPVNEPFAGWVFWPRIPMELVRSVEVIRGGGAGVWGDRALGGVVNIITEVPRRSHATLNLAGGGWNTVRGSLTAGTKWENLRLSASADFLETGGFINVAPAVRGPIDTEVDSRSQVAFGRAVWDLTPLLQVHASASYLDDFRNGGTRLKTNGTLVRDGRAGTRWVTPGGIVLTANAYANASTFNMYQTSESLDRRTETPSLHQFDVPSNAAGVQLQLARTLGRHQVAFGADGSWVDGEVNEDLSYQQNRFTRRRRVTGEQRARGVYLQDAVSLGERVQVLGSLRVDRFRFPAAARRETNLLTNALVTDSVYRTGEGGHTSYNLGVRHQATATLGWRASVYSSYRAPTLNELYKPAREGGNVIIESNETLGPEVLRGFEAGSDWRLSPRAMLRVTGFVNRVQNSIVDRTMGRATTARTIVPCGLVPAGGTCRRRDVVDQVRVYGVESEYEWQVTSGWSLLASHLWNPTEVMRASREPLLEGARVRAAARHSATAALTYAGTRSLGGNLLYRYVGRRFEDDLNSLALPSFAVVDARINYRLPRAATVYLSAENLLDRQYPVNLTSGGFLRIGPPRLFEAGVRASW